MASLGLIEGIAEALASLLKTYSGSWSDSISRRKPFIVVGYFLGAISKPLIGLSTSWMHVLGARAVDRTGKGIRSAPRDAMISDSNSIGASTFGTVNGSTFSPTPGTGGLSMPGATVGGQTLPGQTIPTYNPSSRTAVR
jgi:hypothetical protein